MEPLAVQLVVLTICGIIAAVIAANKGRSVIGWFFGGFLLGILGIIIVAVLANLKTQREKEARIERENRRLREQIRQEQIKSESFRQHAAARLDAHDGHMGLDTRHTLPQQSAAALQLEALSGASLDSPDGMDRADGADDLASLVPTERGATIHVDADAARHAASPPPPRRRSRQWHYESQGESRGPIDDQSLIRMLRNGEIDAATLLWTEGFDDWRPVESIAALRPHLPV